MNVYQSAAYQLAELLSYTNTYHIILVIYLDYVLENNDYVCLCVWQLISVTRKATPAVRQMPQVFTSDNKRQLTAQNVYETCHRVVISDSSSCHHAASTNSR